MKAKDLLPHILKHPMANLVIKTAETEAPAVEAFSKYNPEKTDQIPREKRGIGVGAVYDLLISTLPSAMDNGIGACDQGPGRTAPTLDAFRRPYYGRSEPYLLEKGTTPQLDDAAKFEILRSVWQAMHEPFDATCIHDGKTGLITDNLCEVISLIRSPAGLRVMKRNKTVVLTEDGMVIFTDPCVVNTHHGHISEFTNTTLLDPRRDYARAAQTDKPTPGGASTANQPFGFNDLRDEIKRRMEEDIEIQRQKQQDPVAEAVQQIGEQIRQRQETSGDKQANPQ